MLLGGGLLVGFAIPFTCCMQYVNAWDKRKKAAEARSKTYQGVSPTTTGAASSSSSPSRGASGTSSSQASGGGSSSGTDQKLPRELEVKCKIS